MASIQARSRATGTVYRVMFRVAGEQRSESFVDEGGALEFQALVDRIGGARAVAVRNARAARTDAAVPLLKDWLEEHVRLATQLEVGTKHEYQRLAARTCLPRLGELPLDAIARDDVREWMTWQQSAVAKGGGTLGHKSIKNAQGLLSTVLSAAVEAGHVPTNVAAGLALPKSAHVEDHVFLTPEELRTLLHAVDDHWRPLVLLLAGTGLRWGEATALTVGDVDLDPAVPSVRVVKAWKRGEVGTFRIGAPKTRRSRRTVSLPTEVLAAVAPLCAERGGGELLFTGRQGARVSHQNFYPRVWQPLRELLPAHRRPTIHDLRHTHASMLIRAGVPLPVIQRRLGHESIQTTIDVYGHLDASAGALAAEATDRALADLGPALRSAAAG
jgi:integrase